MWLYRVRSEWVFVQYVKVYKAWKKGGRTDDEIKNYKNLLKEHLESQSLERSKAMHHRQKALQSSERYMCMIIDCMD